MGKKIQSEPKNDTNPKIRQKKIIEETPKHTSPASRSSETAVFFQDNYDTPIGLAKSFQMRKAQALQMLSGNEQVEEFRYREREMEEIEEFVWGVSNGNCRGFRLMMVTGSPGMGKTASISRVLAKNPCPVLAINANINRTLREVQHLVFQHFMGRKPTRILTTEKLIRELINNGCTSPLLVYIEEIDIVLNSHTDDYTCQFLTLFSRKDLNIGLLGVSNTVNALERYNSKANYSLSHVHNLVFAPYSQQILACIVTDKLHQLHARFDFAFQIKQQLLAFVTHKLEALTKGDMRLVNEFLKKLINNLLTQFESLSDSSEQSLFSSGVSATIQIKDIEHIFQKMQNSKQDLIRSLPFNQQLLLSGISFLISTQELLYLNDERILTGMASACETVGLAVTRGKVREWLKQLESYSLVKITEKRDKQVRVTLSINSKQIRKSCPQVKEHYLQSFLRKPTRLLA